MYALFCKLFQCNIKNIGREHFYGENRVYTMMNINPTGFE